MVKIIPFIFFLGVVLAPLSLSVKSEELSARTYNSIPTGQNFLGLAYAYTDGELYTSADVPLDDVQLTLDGQILAYARTFDLLGRLAKIDTNIGHFCGDATAISDEGEPLSRKFCGITDTKLRLSYNFYGAPALTMAEYIKHPKSMVIGASLQVSIPTGEYEKDYILNTGANRWFFKPEIGFSVPWGQWEFDASFGVKIFTDNNDLKRTQRFEQDPIYNLQLHLVYDFSPGYWIAFNTNYFDGGDTYVDGKKSGIKESNHRAGVTYSMSLSRVQSLKFFANTGVTTRLGNDSDAYGIAWTYRWQ